MKLLTLCMFVAMVSAHAKGLAQRVTISGKDLSLKQVFTTIEKQTGYVLFSNKEVLAAAKPVTVSAVNMPLKELLDKVLKDQPIDYVIQGKTIILSRKPAIPVIPRTGIDEQPAQVIGRITDAVGQPMAGVNVIIKGNGKGTVSAVDGSFAIAAKEGDVLQFTFVGFALKEVTVTAALISGAQRGLMVVLNPQTTALEEVAVTVNTGYQTISRERMTGSYSSIQTKRLENKLQPSLLTALEGQAAGMVVTKDGRLEIRGKSTFLANAEPLIVLDGYPITGGLQTINIDNIESITVLKDAVAASIYGARSSNGVIVITTKTAKTGKMQIGYKGSVGTTLTPQLSYLNKTATSDYIDAEVHSYNINPALAQYVYNSYPNASRVTQLLVAKDNGTITAAQMNAELDQLRKNNGIDQLEKYLFRNKLTQQHNLSFSSGSEKNATNAALRYVSNRNSMIGSSDNRLIVDIKNDWKPVSKVTVRLFTNITYNTGSAPGRSAAEFYDYGYYSVMKPYHLIKDPATGSNLDVPAARPELAAQFGAIRGLKPMNYNPLNDLMLETSRNEQFQGRLGGSISVNIIDGLTAEAGGAWTRGSTLVRIIHDVNAYEVRTLFNSTTSLTNPNKHYIPDGSIVDESRDINESYTLRAQVNFNRSWKSKHRLSAIAGGEINKDVLDNNVYPTRYGYNDQAGAFAPFNYTDYNAGVYDADFQYPDGWKPASIGGYQLRDNRFVSIYANSSYEYDNRFIVSGSVRIDQANLFGTNPKYRYKPNWSVGGTYKLAQEKFFNVSWISRLNLRGSYGINGNISLKQGPFLLVRAVGYSATSGGIVYIVTSPPNNDLRWERTQITNVGTDMTLFGGRLNFSLDYYNKLSKDLLAPDYIDATTGWSTITRNAGMARNTGIELSLETDVIKNRLFKWNVYFNGSYNQSKVLKFNYDYLYTTYLTSTSSASLFGSSGGATLKAGYPVDALFSYRFAELDNTGTPLYYDEAKKKVLGGAVQVKDMAYSGTTRPKYVLNLTNTFSYQRFDLSFMLIAQMGAVFRRDTYNGTNYNNKDVAKRWKAPGDEAKTIYPKLAPFSTDGWYFPYADIIIQSADYMKLRDVTLTYTFNDKWWKKVGLNTAKIYLQGRNLWMVRANDFGIDPETMNLSDGGTITRNLPLRPEFYIGLSVNL
ncbi:SusC/RagA family TonB-linked outer membrane protein [Paraflavitalea sp. CAU 1676]|uniref:SusC/RagA family TonB-linked outer membrane protein n=1 Tax=Paraflavitalea sp. CAU 1676 TaxID=3032598 RepID=UPI0023DC3DF5|nr:SusC/RagA family TonB-linked outer membrane protein [Paraflavitalea sp. CAU 1676]MDF2193350.1 SusC/RagA family TonB-linked outer membrane protein [Paraflavitalea sp. CAU 1676]